MSVYPENITLGDGIQVGVIPLFSGHHTVWASRMTQADICNNTDDFVVLNCATGQKHRFPITVAFLPWLRDLIDTMNACDRVARSPWSEHNAATRDILFNAAERVVKGDPPQLNILQPPPVAPALASARDDVDDEILRIIAAQPESLIS